MLTTREIPRERWGEYLEQLAERERDHPVRLEIIGKPLGAQPIEEHAPLLGIEFEKKGSEKGAIEVTVGGENGRLGHRIESPVHLYAEENAAGEVETLDIEDREQVKTLVIFEHPMALEA
ncbi:MAG: DUF5335 family protein [Myxococcaceae bacterium]